MIKDRGVEGLKLRAAEAEREMVVEIDRPAGFGHVAGKIR
jgi:hypothetical protein